MDHISIGKDCVDRPRELVTPTISTGREILRRSSWCHDEIDAATDAPHISDGRENIVM